MNNRPFEKIRVLDLAHVLAGPFCSYLLALLGADVLKIEPPDEPDEVRGRGPDAELNAESMGINYLAQGANKKAITLNLKSAAGRKIFTELAATADVVIENYRTGALAALGLGYKEIASINPRVVYCSMTGFGQEGPRAAVNAYDNVIQAASGLMSVTGTPQLHPLKTGAPIVDYASGLNAAFAVAAALFRREGTGRGVHIDCSMMDTAMFLMASQVAAVLHTDVFAPIYRGNDQLESGLCCYETAEGLLMMGAFNRRQHERLWRAFERPDFAAYSSWEDMAAHSSEMREDLARRLRGRSAASWEEYFHGIGVPAERVRTLKEAIEIAQSPERALTAELESPKPGGVPIRVLAFPFHYSEGGPEVTSPPPRIGQHTHEVLRSLGYSNEQISNFQSEGVV